MPKLRTRAHSGMRRGLALSLLATLLMAGLGRAQAPNPAKIYIILWFDTEDYILPESDNAAKRLAAFLTRQHVNATFKIVGEKARVLERRGRRDVIGALAEQEIGYHSNLHSQHPTPAEYESDLGWSEGVEEFTRRERAGFDDVVRILGQAPTCYGQPGSSWTPQAFGALKKWGVKVYLDEGEQVGLNGRPFWYGGLLNIFNTKEGARLRPNADWSNLPDAEANFQAIYERLSGRREGGIISLYFHPCEFVHREFWDAVNFSRGQNPPPEEWKTPAVKSPEESEKAFKYFEDLVTYMKSFPRVEFITASQAFEIFRDTAQKRGYSSQELNDIARQVDANVSFQVHDDYTLAASEVFLLLNKFVSGVAGKSSSEPILLDGTPYGPSSTCAPLTKAAEISWSQFSRTSLDVADFLEKNDQVPGTVWMGSLPVPPESYLVALARVTETLVGKGEAPETVMIEPAKLAAAQYVADDSPALWGWVIFPEGFRAANMMGLAKLQAWTLKPAALPRAR